MFGQTKGILQSKTLWFNFLIAFIGFIEKFVTDSNILDAQSLLVINLVGNAILRFVTSKKITSGS